MLRPGAPGFTLIELMITIAIVGLLVAFGLPAMGTFIANTKVRASAEGLQTGLAHARAAAIKRNQNVEFVATNDVIDPTTVDTVTPANDGRSWLIRVLDPATATYSLIESKSATEGSGQQEGASTGVVQVAGSVAQVTFRGLGGTNLASAATFDFSNPAGGACNTLGTPGPVRCLRVQVSVAGLIRICDPSTVAPDSRAC